MIELEEVRQELQECKGAMVIGGMYLGMSGQILQEYFLQLCERENVLLAVQLRKDPEALMLDSFCHLPKQTATCSAPKSTPSSSMDPSNLQSIFDHLEKHASDAQQVAKGLNALASLAYANPVEVCRRHNAVFIVLSLLELHIQAFDGASEKSYQITVILAAMKFFCNIAYDPTVVKERLTEPAVLVDIAIMPALFLDVKSVSDRAHETLARIFASWEHDASKPLNALLTAWATSQQPFVEGTEKVVAQLLDKLIQLKVLTDSQVAHQLAAMMDIFGGSDDPDAEALQRVYGLSYELDSPAQQAALIEAAGLLAQSKRSVDLG